MKQKRVNIGNGDIETGNRLYTNDEQYLDILITKSIDWEKFIYCKIQCVLCNVAAAIVMNLLNNRDDFALYFSYLYL